MYLGIVKPLFDLVFSFILFILFLPLFLAVSIILAASLKGNPLFFQKRNGKDGRAFWVIKFRTMTNERDAKENLLPNAERITPVGRVIRRLSVDEFPQLLNVLKGEMSFIGPRPLPTRYFPYFDKKERSRFKVLPGISGLAQVSGRNHLMWDKRLAKDIEYVDKISFIMDMKIIFLTLKKVVSRDDIAVDPTQVMVDFDVYKKSKCRDETN